MTAVQSTVKRPPRLLIRTFWMLHRAVYRITGGRFGLQEPVAGGRFGMMQLTTRGRRSGQLRSTIVGYFEDGSNLVTLAMNGWGLADPDWWLNLQSDPEAKVTLPDGPRAMHARAATGAERARLWATFREYPGWGDDIDALATGRPRETAVVVFEPSPAATGQAVEADNQERGGAAGATPAIPSGERRAAAVAAGACAGRSRRRLKVRHVWLVPGLAIAFYANSVSALHGLGLVPVLLFGILPHLSVLVGTGQPHARGQLAPRAVPVFNAMHHPMVPLALSGIAATGLMTPFWFVGGLAWLSHIVIDWALGEGLKTQDGFMRSGVDRLIGVKTATPQPVRVTE